MKRGLPETDDSNTKRRKGTQLTYIAPLNGFKYPSPSAYYRQGFPHVAMVNGIKIKRVFLNKKILQWSDVPTDGSIVTTVKDFNTFLLRDGENIIVLNKTCGENCKFIDKKNPSPLSKLWRYDHNWYDIHTN